MSLARSAFTLSVSVAAISGCGTLADRSAQITLPKQSALVPFSHPLPGAARIGPDWKMHALYDFGGNPDGESPNSGAIAPRRRAPYPQIIGTTEFGGYYGEGTLYGLLKGKTGWDETVLYSFDAYTAARPVGISVPKELNENSRVFVAGFGFGNSYGSVTVLKPSTSGNWTLLTSYSFQGTPDGAAPEGAPMEDANGNLYGTTLDGGTHGEGAVYELTPTGSGYTERVIYSFKVGTDGHHPYGNLVDIDDNLYGSTQQGGSKGFGTVFKLTPSGSRYTETVLYSFKGPPSDGEQPQAGLCAGSGSTLYGTTPLGGYDGGGTVFEILTSSAKHPEHVIWSFGGFYHDGINPVAPVVVNTQGAVYGTTRGGGKVGVGTLFLLTPKGSAFKEKLYDFNGYNGGGPVGAPGPDGHGHLYLSASGNGDHLDGTVAEAKGNAQATLCNPGSVTING